MSGLESIKVKVEGLGGSAAFAHNALPVLHEIRHALAELAGGGEPTVIDLSAIPFGPGDREQLFQVLGEGEIKATLSAMGESLIRETAYPGVWLVTHLSPQGEELATHIEVARLPALLITPELDVKDALAALSARLQADDPLHPESETNT